MFSRRKYLKRRILLSLIGISFSVTGFQNGLAKDDIVIPKIGTNRITELDNTDGLATLEIGATYDQKSVSVRGTGFNEVNVRPNDSGTILNLHKLSDETKFVITTGELIPVSLNKDAYYWDNNILTTINRINIFGQSAFSIDNLIYTYYKDYTDYYWKRPGITGKELFEAYTNTKIYNPVKTSLGVGDIRSTISVDNTGKMYFNSISYDEKAIHISDPLLTLDKDGNVNIKGNLNVEGITTIGNQSRSNVIYNGGLKDGTFTPSSEINSSNSNIQFAFGDGLKVQEVANGNNKIAFVSLDSSYIKSNPDYQGLKGETGDKGATGDKGPQGDQGLKGETGDKGATGDKGPQGDQGLKGETGDKGATGDKGPQGDQGLKGETGDKGATGDKGPSGSMSVDPAIISKLDSQGATINNLVESVNNITANGIAITNGPTFTKNTIDAAGLQIHGVGDGVAPLDAVNKRQLDEVDRRLQKDIAKAGALSAALGALNTSVDPRAKTSILAGIGYYDSQSAMAIGLAHRINDDVRMSTGIAYGNDEVMANMGVSIAIGRKSDFDDKGNRYNDSLAKQSQLNNELQQTVAKQQEMILEQQAELNELKEILKKVVEQH